MKNLVIGLVIVAVLYFVAPPVITLIVVISAGIGTVIGMLLPFILGLGALGAVLWVIGKAFSYPNNKVKKEE